MPVLHIICLLLNLQNFPYLPPLTAVNEKAIKLNETLGSQDRTAERNLQELQKEIDRMLKELRSKDLQTQKEVAEDELV